jgi:D-glycero-D-manno-heptose 1,7-bisphosphate phosphatase
VTHWEDFHVLPGVVEGIALLNRTGFYVIVATNQRCIAKGLMTEADLQEIRQRMSDALARGGATIDGIYYCPHEMEPSCNCRKPAPGMLLDAARSRGIDLTASWMIGDSDIDVEAGRNAGCKTARLLTTNGISDETGRSPTTPNSADICCTSASRRHSPDPASGGGRCWLVHERRRNHIEPMCDRHATAPRRLDGPKIKRSARHCCVARVE